MSTLLHQAISIRDQSLRSNPFVLVIGLMMLVVAAYWQSYDTMIDMWSLQTYQYGWLIFPISLVMLWHSRYEIAAAQIRPSATGLAVLLLAVAIWIMASGVNVRVIELVAATLIIPATVWGICGSQVLGKALFPLVFLVAAVPVGESIIPALMRSTADIATALLELVNVPAYREGQFLTLPGGQFEVADVCSGLRYLLAGTVLALLFAYWNYRSIYKRIVFVVGLAGIFIIANGVRAFIVMYVASATNMRVFGGRDHVIFGQLLFIALFLALLWIGSRYADARPEPRNSVSERGRQPVWRPVIMILSAVVLVFGPLANRISEAGDRAARLPLADIALPSCESAGTWRPAWQPVLVMPEAESAQSWQCGRVVLSIYQAAYSSQMQGRELVSEINDLWPYQWRRLALVSPHSMTLRGEEVSVIEVYHPQEAEATLAWYFYQVDETRTRSEFVVKLLEALNALRLREPNAALVAIVAEGPGDRDDLRAAAQRAISGI